MNNSWAVQETWTAHELDQRWGNTPFGFDHFYIAVGLRDADLPTSRTDGVEGTLNAADGIGATVGGYDRIVHAHSAGELLRGVGDIGLGVPQALSGGVLGGVQLGATYVQELVRDVPIVGSPLAAGFEHLEQRLGTVNIAVTAASNSIAHVSSSLQHFADGELFAGASELFQSQVDLAHGAVEVTVDVVRDTVDGVVNAVESVVDAATDVASSVGSAVRSAVDRIGAWTGWW